MMSTAEIPAGLRAQYQRERAAMGGPLPIRAITALALARYHAKTAQDFGWTEGRGQSLTAERDGFSLRATWTYDEDGGGFSSGLYNSEQGGDRWAVPVYFERGGVGLASGQNASTWFHDQDADHWYEYMRKQGASRDVAEAETRRYMRERATDDNTEYVITVKAFRAGVELGRASMGGFGLDPDDYDEARQIAAAIEDYGMTDEAITEARQTLATLREEDE